MSINLQDTVDYVKTLEIKKIISIVAAIISFFSASFFIYLFFLDRDLIFLADSDAFLKYSMSIGLTFIAIKFLVSFAFKAFAYIIEGTLRILEGDAEGLLNILLGSLNNIWVEWFFSILLFVFYYFELYFSLVFFLCILCVLIFPFIISFFACFGESNGDGVVSFMSIISLVNRNVFCRPTEWKNIFIKYLSLVVLGFACIFGWVKAQYVINSSNYMVVYNSKDKVRGGLIMNNSSGIFMYSINGWLFIPWNKIEKIR